MGSEPVMLYRSRSCSSMPIADYDSRAASVDSNELVRRWLERNRQGGMRSSLTSASMGMAALSDIYERASTTRLHVSCDELTKRLFGSDFSVKSDYSDVPSHIDTGDTESGENICYQILCEHEDFEIGPSASYYFQKLLEQEQEDGQDRPGPSGLNAYADSAENLAEESLEQMKITDDGEKEAHP